MMDAQKIQLDRTGQLLIVESFNHVKDEETSTRENQYLTKEHEIIIFNISDLRQLITIPGKLEDISNQNELILNLESQCRHDPNDYTGRNKINELAFTKLDLNELIENKSKFNAKKITKSFNLNEFTTNDDFINKLKDYNVFYDATNNFNSDFVSNIVCKNPKTFCIVYVSGVDFNNVLSFICLIIVSLVSLNSKALALTVVF